MPGKYMLTSIQYKNIVVKWIEGVKFNNPFAITLTMRVNKFNDISQNLRYFINRLNQRYLKSSYKVFKKRLKVIPILEGNDVIHYHYHLIIDNPYNNRDEEFKKLIRECWRKTPLYNSSIDIKTMKDKGWIRYIMKSRSKKSIMDSIDWSNTQI